MKTMRYFIWSTLLLFGPGLCPAQEIDLPPVINWETPQNHQFKVNQQIKLAFSSPGMDKSQLMLRLFRGAKKDLIAGKICVPYYSWVANYAGPSAGDEVLFNRWIGVDYLESRSDGGNDDQTWTVVLEKRNTVKDYLDFFPTVDKIRSYFESGLQIVVQCNGYCDAGWWPQFKARIKSELEARNENQGVTTGAAPSSPVSPPSTSTVSKLDCVRIVTVASDHAENSSEPTLLTKLVPGICGLDEQQPPFHLPFVHSGLLLR